MLTNHVRSVWPLLASAKASETENQRESGLYWSPRAGGVFEVPFGVALSDLDEETKRRVSTWIWEKNIAFDVLAPNEESEYPQVTQALVRNLKGQPTLGVEQRIDHALHAIGRPPQTAPVSPHQTDYRHLEEEALTLSAATGCGSDIEELHWLLKELAQAGLVTSSPPQKRQLERTMLTIKGLARLETGGPSVASSTAFVAMWFDEEVRDAYDKGIKPAISKAGYEPMRIDRKHHNRKIDDEIVAEIRRSRFLVCDLTCSLLSNDTAESGKIPVARGGVYYEAGFAQGLGKEVIWTCRRDLLEHIHFDLRQYACIVWENGKEHELKNDLYERIRAVIA